MTIEQWLGEDNKLGIDVWNKKYRFNEESFEEWLDRVSSGNQKLRKLIKEKKFLFGGRILANINTGTKQGISNCTTLGYVKDDLNDIMDTAKNLALSYKSEAGVGIALSKIRPKGAKIGEKGVSDGVIGFLKIFNSITENISRGNQRRGAMLVGLHAEHPDIIDFINIKKKNSGATGMITSANLSVLVTDEFMRNYKNKTKYRHDFIVESTGEVIEHTVDPVMIMEAIIDTPKTSFEPGILFVDRYKEQHLFGGAYGDMELFNNACCFTGDMKLLTVNGYKRFDEIVNTIQEIFDKCGNKSESRIWSSGTKKVYNVKANRINIATCTDNHVFLTVDGKEIEAQHLVGSRLMPNINETIEKDKWFVQLGFIQGNGGTGRLNSKSHKGIEVYIGDKDEDIYDYFNISKDVNFQESKRAYYIDFDLNKMRDLGMSSKPVWERDFPTTYNNWTLTQKASFLKGLFSANGYVLNKYGRVGIKTTSRSEANSIIKTLTEDFNIKAYITTNKPKKIQWSNGEYISKESYDINISDWSSRIKFSEMINFIHKYKKEILKNTLIATSPKITSVKYAGTQEVYDFEEPNVHFGIVNGVVVHNSEFIGAKGTICLLGSMNLSAYVKDFKFNFIEFEKDVETAIRSMDRAHDYGIGRNGLDIQNDRARDYRGLGLGITGLADMFMKLGIVYGSKESIEISDKIASTMRDIAIKTSLQLGKELGQPIGILEDEARMEALGLDFIKGLRNNSLLSIAPAGSLSLLLNTSSGIEPVFRTSYTRKTESLNDIDTYYDVFHKPIQDIIDKFGYKPDYCIDTRDIKAKDKINVIATWQKYVDLSISNTTNFASDTQVEEIREAYVYAWEQGVKGLTVYVDGSIEGVLNDIKEKSKDKNNNESLDRGIMDKVPEDTIYYPREMNHGCGKAKVMVGYSPSENRITDVYHIEKGKGGCSKNTQGEAILISQVLRLGGNLEDIKKSFGGIGACTSCILPKKDGRKVDGINCPNILLKIVLEAKKELVDKNKPSLEQKNKVEEVKKENVKENTEIDNKYICPECNAVLHPEGACFTCTECGYSKCE